MNNFDYDYIKERDFDSCNERPRNRDLEELQLQTDEISGWIGELIDLLSADNEDKNAIEDILYQLDWVLELGKRDLVVKYLNKKTF